MLALAACDDERTCLFDEFTDEYVAGADVEDCGDVESSLQLDEPRYAAVRPCVVAANAEQRPFVVRWDVQGIEGIWRQAYVGRSIDGAWEVSRFSRGSYGQGYPSALRLVCTRFDDQGDACGSVVEELCFRCTADEPVDSCAAAD